MKYNYFCVPDNTTALKIYQRIIFMRQKKQVKICVMQSLEKKVFLSYKCMLNSVIIYLKDLKTFTEWHSVGGGQNDTVTC